MSQEGLEITLPSGLQGIARGVEIGDIKQLSGPQGSGKARDPLTAFLGGLWLETIDPGPYTWPNQNVIGNDGRINWSHVLQGDAAAFLLEARAATFGDDVYFKPVCNHKPCQHEFPWQFKISELKRGRLSDVAFQAVQEKGPAAAQFEVALPRAGVTVGWKLLTRGDQYRVDVASEGDDALIGENGLLARLPYIPGADSPGARRRFVQRLGLLDSEILREEYEEHDLMIQDTLEIRCPKCRRRQEIAIPVDRDFFSLRSARPPKNASNEFDG